MLRRPLRLLFALALAGALAVPDAKAQPVPDDALAARITDTLVADGFTNVAAVVEGASVRATYENSRFRYDVRALQHVMRRVMPLLPPDADLTLVPQRTGVPLVAVTASAADWDALQAGTLTPEAFTETWTITLRTGAARRGLPAETHRSFGRLDVVVVPQFAAQLGNFEDAVESQFNLAPTLRLSAWKGMEVAAQLIVPLQNDLGTDGDAVRPGLVTVSQAVRLPRGLALRAAAGYFTENRYGVDVRLAAPLFGGRVSVHAGGGRTGFAAYRGGEWRYARPDAWTGGVGVRVLVLPRQAFEVQADYGRFLFADTGLRLGVNRTFGEVQLGFYGLLTERGDNAGFSIVLPLPPARRMRPRRLRVRPADSSAWAYRYRRLPEGGRLYATGAPIAPYTGDVAPALLRRLAADLPGWR